MNEKTKKIISYIGCALGGMALGIALLGGLSYCSTANKATTESVNTILTKKNAVITTDGGYTGYQFTLYNGFPGTENTANCEIYTIDLSTYTLTISSSYQVNVSTIAENINAVNSLYSSAIPTQGNKINFIAYWSYSNIWGSTNYRNSFYFSFVRPSNYGLEMSNTNLYPFILTTDHTNFMPLSLSSGQWIYGRTNNPYMLVNDKSDLFYINNTDINRVNSTEDWTFQDITTYYKEAGYQDGYDNGYDDGETTGYNSGYEVGYSDGSETGRMFTALGLNQTTWYKSDLTPTSTSETSNFYKLLEFKDGDNEEWGVAAELFTTDNLFKVDLYKNINQGYTSATYYGTLGEGTLTYVSGVWQVEMTPATYYFFEWAQITEVYNNSLPLNYFLLTGTPQNATGYQQGYQAGYQAGILATPGGEATNNVFSLFTSAFDSVGGFFNLKIFGFLPLYWFFLAPLFVALITLLLRMVKH